MLLRRWLASLRRWLGWGVAKPRPPAKRRPGLGFESLEGRTVPTTKLFLDFGEGFAGGGLQMTVDQLRDTYANGGLQGPDLRFAFNGGQTLTFTPMSAAVNFDYNGDGAVNNQDYVALKTAIVAIIERTYAPFDIDVEVRAAASRQDVINAMAANAGSPTGSNDTYVFMVNMSPNIDGLYGISRGTDIGGDNLTEETVLTFTDNSFSFAPIPDADTVVANTTTHEAGHAFSLRHTDNFSTTDSILLTQSDVIAQFGSPELDTNYLFITRFPLMVGDGNSDPNVTVNSYDELATDPDIGLRAGFPAYVTGTGTYDRITVAANGSGGANVTIEAFRNADFTGLIRSYAYTLNDLSNGILIEAGYFTDRIFLDGALGTDVTVRGMAGFDQLFINGAGLDGEYAPNGNTTIGYDGATYFGGTITVGANVVRVEEFRSVSPAVINVTNFGKFTVVTAAGLDVITIDAPTASTNSITGTTGGVEFIPLVFNNVVSFGIDTGGNDSLPVNDQVTLAASGLVATGLQNFAVVTGGGDDVFNVLAVDYRPPVAGGVVAFDGEGGNDRIVTAANVNFTLNAVGLASSAGGQIQLTDVEFAQLAGGAGNNTLFLGDWGGGASFNGLARTDRIVATDDVNFTLANNLLQRGGLPDVTLQSVEDALLTGGPSDNSFDVSGWTGAATVNGAGGTDVIVAAANANFTLTNTTLTRTPGGTINLVSIESAALTGGAGDNTFTISGWTAGTLTLNGLGGSDTVVAVNDVDFTLTNATLLRGGLSPVSLSSIEVANLSGGAGNNVFTVTGWTGTGTLNGQGGTGDAIVAINDVDFFISNTTLTRSGMGALTLANFEVANLTGGASDNVFTVGVWSGTGLLDGGAHAAGDLLQTSGDANFTLTDATLAQGGNVINHVGFERANLTGGPGNNVFTVTGWTIGALSIDGLGGADTVVVANDVNFELRDDALLRSGLLPIALVNVENANLTGGPGNNVFLISNWSGGGALAGAGGSDTVIAVNDVNFTLLNTSLTRSGLGTFTLSSIEVANLTGGPSDNVFTINGWTGTGTLDGQGQIDADRLNVVQDADFILTDGSFDVPGVGLLTLVSIEALDVTGGPSSNTFDVTNWSGRSTIDGGGQPVGGGDRIIASNDVNFILSDGLLRRTGRADLTLVNVEIAILTGGPGNNVFDVSGWTGGGSLDAGGQTVLDRLIATGDTNFVLRDNSLARTGHGTLTLANFESANLTGGDGNNVFDVSGWTRQLVVDGQGGAGDVIAAANNLNFTLTPAALIRNGLPNVSLFGIELANLMGGLGNNVFNVSAWPGGGAFDGAGGLDLIVAVNDVDFTLSDSTLGRSFLPPLALVSVEQAQLTGGNASNTFTVANWSGTAELDGAGGGDTYVLQLVGAGAGATNVKDTGKSGIDVLQVLGTAGNDLFAVNNKRSSLLNETFNFQRVERVQFNGGDGDDTFNFAAKKLDKAIKELVLQGDLGNDRFNVTPSNVPITVNGGDPAFPTKPGDFLFLDLRGGRMIQLVLPNDGSGQFRFLNRSPIRFLSIESGFGGGLQDLLP